MRPSAIRLSRRPIAVALIVCAACLASPAAAYAQKLVFVVRHAERADGGAATGQMGAPADPALSAAGEARAAKLAALLADAGVKAIFTTEFRRTLDTGKPLAGKLGLTVQSMPARDTGALVQKIKTAHAGDVVLIVGHSNTVPDIIKALGGPDVKVGDDEYDNLFVLVPSTGTLTRIRF
jgi:broad specificity phosphatase PhoE